MKRKEYLINQMEVNLRSLIDKIENFDHLEDWKIEKEINEVSGFREGFRFAQSYFDREVMRTNEELQQYYVEKQTYPEFDELWDKIEDKLYELKKMFQLNDETEAFFIAEEEKEKLRKSKI